MEEAYASPILCAIHLIKLVTLFAFSVCLAASAAELSGRVVGVHDGDTITVLDANHQQHKIRLAGIDAPEIKQAFGAQSKQKLSDLIFGKYVVVEWEKRDRYKRIVGKVLGEESGLNCGFRDCPTTLDAGLAQVRDGVAWHYKQYKREQSPQDRARYSAAESNARASKSGLWENSKPVPPWEWRREKRGSP